MTGDCHVRFCEGFGALATLLFNKITSVSDSRLFTFMNKILFLPEEFCVVFPNRKSFSNDAINLIKSPGLLIN